MDPVTKLAAIQQALTAAYGPRPHRPRLDAVSELVLTILSQNTSDVNRDRAYDRLMAAFDSWDAIASAPAKAIAEAIRPGGLSQIKAPRIQHALRTIHVARGAYDLDFLADRPLDEAKAWLTNLDGVGPKTAACVLLFSLGRPAMPVDTHVHRVSGRLGLAPRRASPPRVQEILEAALPAEAIYPVHLQLIAHGRAICKAQRPRCDDCPLAAWCDYAHHAGDWADVLPSLAGRGRGYSPAKPGRVES
ncbi:MAG: endonuclease III [Chloroflexi bacterium]|nr:endonuclease III [Chloroflexota bacterium]MBU1750390.1 endonuclease III [Chloroflexota bacterium]